MPQTTVITTTSNFTIDPYIYSLYFKAYGASGGGENVVTSNLTTTAGTSGGETSFLGFSLSGGQGGGIGGKNQGGGAGTTTQTFNWATVSGQSIIFPTVAAAGGQLSGGGLGGLIDGSRNNGGSGSSGSATYTSSMTHVFDNASNTHNFSQSGSTSDISLNYRNPGAADGITGFTPSNGKYYELTFTNPYVDNNWTFSIPSNQICQQSAGGGTGAPPYGVNGTANQTASGINIWFQNGKGGNGYIRCFTIQTTGVKVGATGRGGGGASAVEGIFPRQSLIDSVTFAPGTTFQAKIGARGNSGGTNSNNGVEGEILVTETIYPQVYLSSNKLVLKPSDPTATLTWSSAGDLDAIRWPFNGDVTNGNLNSFALVSPTQTTTYTAEGYNTSISDLVSFNPEASLTIVVLQAPVISTFVVTETLDYNGSGSIEWEVKYANTGSTLQIYHSWDDGPKRDNPPELITTIDIPACASAEETGDDTQTVVKSNFNGVDGPIPYTPAWDTWGPSEITYVLTANGEGGTVVAPMQSTTVIIDREPENMAIPETEDTFKDQDPVFTTPDADVVSQLLLVNDIDIPVEIKSNYPVEVQINDAGGFKKVRSI